MSNHTPGPWEIMADGLTIQAPVDPENSSTYYAPVAFVDDEWSREIIGANAALIAAAPDLLSALERIAMRASCAPNDDADRAAEEFTRIMNEARAAIAKARGVQS